MHEEEDNETTVSFGEARGGEGLTNLIWLGHFIVHFITTHG